MNFLEDFLSWTTVAFELTLCWFVFRSGAQRAIPLFAAYVYTFVASSLGVFFTYHFFGYDSHAAYYAYWISTYIYGAAQSLAIVELCRYGLRNYRGIWALVWRVLALLSILLITHAAVDAWGQPKGVAIFGLTLGRDLALASVVILVALFAIRNYYGVSLDDLQRLIAGGICLSCAVDAIGDTLLRNLYINDFISWFLTSERSQWPALWPFVRRAQDAWSAAHLVTFMVSMGIWCYALREPVIEMEAKPELLPVDVYREMSPAINLRLATFNDRLVELLKP